MTKIIRHSHFSKNLHEISAMIIQWLISPIMLNQPKLPLCVSQVYGVFFNKNEKKRYFINTFDFFSIFATKYR